MSDDEFVNIHGLARILQLPCKWLEAEVNAGRLPCLRIGNRFRFSVAAVKSALAEQAANAAVEPRKQQGERHEQATASP